MGEYRLLPSLSITSLSSVLTTLSNSISDSAWNLKFTTVRAKWMKFEPRGAKVDIYWTLSKSVVLDQFRDYSEHFPKFPIFKKY